MEEQNSKELTDLKQEAFKLMKRMDDAQNEYDDLLKVSLIDACSLNYAESWSDLTTNDFMRILISSLEYAFVADVKRLKKEKENCKCGKPLKPPYPSCYHCLIKNRENQTKCDCGKYINSNKSIYSLKPFTKCYACFTNK